MNNINQLIAFDLPNMTDHYRLEIEVGGKISLFNFNDNKPLRQAILSHLKQKESKIVRYSRLPHNRGYGKPLSGVLTNAFRVAYVVLESGEIKYMVVDRNNAVIMQLPSDQVQEFCVSNDLPIKVVLPFTL